MSVKASTGGSNGFFGTIGSGIAEGVSRIGSDILPIFAADQLDLQKKDQLKAPTFDQRAAKPKVNTQESTTQSTQRAKDAGLFTGGFFSGNEISGTALLGIAVAAVVGIIVARS